jgi:hypothetical protein
MYVLRAMRLWLLPVILFSASCTTEPSTSSRELKEVGVSTLDRPVPSHRDATAAVRAPARAAIVAGAKQVGYYDMFAGEGQSYQLTAIAAAGGTAVNVFDPDAAGLASLNVFWVLNPDNDRFGSEYLARLASIDAAVQNGMILVIHDRAVTNAASILPGGAAAGIFRDFAEPADINIRDASTAVTAGMTNSSLDGGGFSSHGFALANTLPARAKLILSTTTSDHIVTFCYPAGRGAVIYSSIPLDAYLHGTGSPLLDAMAAYASNVVTYALAGACRQVTTGPRPTPN